MTTSVSSRKTDLANLIRIAALAVAAPMLAAPDPVPAQASPGAPAGRPTQTGRLPINGLNYYFEIHGEGEPLLLLHGGLGSIDMFGPVLPRLAEGRRVIAVDLQGHGRTELGARPLSLVAMADDMASAPRT